MTTIRIKEFHGDFTYTVDESKVSATGKIFLKGEQSFGFDLDQIAEIPIVIERRHPDFRKGLYWMAGAIAAVVMRSKIPSEDFQILVICGSVAGFFIGALLVFSFMRKMRFITITNHNGQGLFSLIRTHENSREVDQLLMLLGVNSHPEQETHS